MMISLRQLFIIFTCIYLSTTVLLLSLLTNEVLYCPMNGPLTPRTTCVIIEFENFDNNLLNTVQSLCVHFSDIIVLSTTFIYPSVNFSSIDNCQIKVVDESIYNSYKDVNLDSLIQSDYLIVVPDFVRLNHKVLNLENLLQKQLKTLNVDALVIPLYGPEESSLNLTCKHFTFDVKRWTLSYVNYSQIENSHCHSTNDDQFVVFVTKSSLLKLSHPFNRPFLKSFSIQSQIKNLKSSLLTRRLFIRKKDYYANERSKDKLYQLEKYRTNLLYNTLGVKKVQHLDGSVEWFGCDRQKPRCFGSIIDDVPDYLVQQRWLPPCCLQNLEITGRYVFSLLDKLGIRYWLEGGSLLGAARNGKIIDWDYDIDIGIYREDTKKFAIINSLLNREAGYQLEDGQGFLWEKAIEGDFIKVHYSRINRIHVDIFPFHSVNQTMTKRTWFESHPQDKPFPEHYLQPLNRIDFIDYNTSVPNNIKEFLEFKFGPNCIENPKYP